MPLSCEKETPEFLPP